MAQLEMNSARETGPSLPVWEATPGSRRVSPRHAITSWRVAKMIGARDIKAKYKQSALGPVWLVLQPMGFLAAITVAFSGVTQVDTRGVPYLLFGLVGVAVWNFVSMTLLVAPTTFTNNVDLVKRSPAPRLAFVTGTVISNTPLLGIVVAFTLLAIAVERGFELQVLLLPALIAWLLVVTWSIVLLMAPLAARFRDVIAIVPVIVQAGIFLAPVGYDTRSAPSNIELLVSLNPLTGIIEAWRWCLLGMTPVGNVIAIALAWTVALLVLGWTIFRRMEVRLADFV